MQGTQLNYHSKRQVTFNLRVRNVHSFANHSKRFQFLKWRQVQTYSISLILNKTENDRNLPALLNYWNFGKLMVQRQVYSCYYNHDNQKKYCRYFQFDLKRWTTSQRTIFLLHSVEVVPDIFLALPIQFQFDRCLRRPL